MMFMVSDHLVRLGCGCMQGDAVSAVTHLYFAAVLTHPDFPAGILPRHRVTAALPRHVGIPCDLALLVVAVRVRRSTVDRFQSHPVLLPPLHYDFVRRAMHALIGHFRHP